MTGVSKVSQISKVTEVSKVSQVSKVAEVSKVCQVSKVSLMIRVSQASEVSNVRTYKWLLRVHYKYYIWSIYHIFIIVTADLYVA